MSPPDRPSSPPRLLLGVAVLFWGGLSGHPVVALVLAALLEAPHWTRLRWDFSETAFRNAWHLSVILCGFAALLIWLDGARFSALQRTVVWLPVLFLPVQFTQSYGMRERMPLSTFSLYVRKRQAHAKRHGLPFRSAEFAFGNVYFVMVVVASALGRHAESPVFLPGIALLSVAALLPRLRHGRLTRVAAALLVTGLALAGGYALSLIHI